MKPIIKELTRLGDAAMVLTDDRLNRGGCGVYASLVCNRLQALGYKVYGGVHACYRGHWEAGYDLDVMTEQLRHNGVDMDHVSVQDYNRLGVYVVHIAVDFEDDDGHRWLVDSENQIEWDGAHRFDPDDPDHSEPARFGQWSATMPGHWPVPVLASIAADANGWNSSFDRDWIADLAKLVEDTLTTPARVDLPMAA